MRRHERRHRPHGIPPAPGPLDPCDPRAGRRRPADGSRVQARAGAGRPQRAQLRAMAEQHGVEHWTDRPGRRARRPPVDIFFDAQVTSRRARTRHRRAIAGRQARLQRRSRPPRPSRAPSTSPGSRGRRRRARRRARQSSSCRACVKLRRLVDEGFFGRILSRARRVRLLGVRGRLARRRSGRRGTTAPRTAAASSTDMFCRTGTTCWTSFFGRVEAGAPRRPPPTSRSAGTSRARPTPPPPTTPPTASSSSAGRRRSRRSTRPGPCASTATSWWSSRWTAPTAPPSPGCARCRVQQPPGDAQAGVEPDLARHGGRSATSGWTSRQRRARQRLQGRSGSCSCATCAGRARAAGTCLAGARGVQLAELGLQSSARGPPPRGPGAAAPVTVPAAPPPPARCAAVRTAFAEPRRYFVRPGDAAASRRVVFAAAHVVRRSAAETAARRAAAVDWEATLAFRRHLWAHGLGVAEAMDTAQRGMGLDWAAAAGADPPLGRRGAVRRRPDRVRRGHRPARPGRRRRPRPR